MFRILLSVIVAMLITSVSLAQTVAPKPDEKAPEAKKPPTRRRRRPAYDPVAERAKFFKIAGKDTEVDKSEFTAALAKAGDKGEGFVRKSDKWSSLLRYDKNNNSKIDWFEADAYRQSLRRGRGRSRGRFSRRRGMDTSDPATIKKYDKDGDGKLSSEEQTIARSARAEERRQEFMKQYDKDGDGKFSEEEQKAIRDGFRKRIADWRQRAAERRYDKDGDGKLNTEETAAMKKGEAERTAAREKRRKDFMDKYDKDKDGEISDEERSASRADMRKRWTERRYDKDGDGKLNDEEAAAMKKGEADRAAARKKRAEDYIKQYDKDGDGKVSDEERPARRRFGRRGRRRGAGGGATDGQ